MKTTWEIIKKDTIQKVVIEAPSLEEAWELVSNQFPADPFRLVSSEDPEDLLRAYCAVKQALQEGR